METNPFPAILCWILNIEYSVITSDSIKSFDCTIKHIFYFLPGLWCRSSY